MNDNAKRNYEVFTRKNVGAVSFWDVVRQSGKLGSEDRNLTELSNCYHGVTVILSV